MYNPYVSKIYVIKAYDLLGSNALCWTPKTVLSHKGFNKVKTGISTTKREIKIVNNIVFRLDENIYIYCIYFLIFLFFFIFFIFFIN